MKNTYDAALMNIAFGHVYNLNVSLNNETDGARWHNALHKAFDEIEQNDTIEFDNNVLRFFSRETGEQRVVTAFGCHAATCDCQNQISYHAGIYKILAHYFELVARRDDPFYGLEPLTPEEIDACDARCRVAHAEFVAFAASLPAWVSDMEYMNLFLMTGAEFAKWFESNSPYLKISSTKKPETLAGVRF